MSCENARSSFLRAHRVRTTFITQCCPKLTQLWHNMLRQESNRLFQACHRLPQAVTGEWSEAEDVTRQIITLSLMRQCRNFLFVCHFTLPASLPDPTPAEFLIPGLCCCSRIVVSAKEVAPVTVLISTVLSALGFLWVVSPPEAQRKRTGEIKLAPGNRHSMRKRTCCIKSTRLSGPKFIIGYPVPS